MPVLMRRHRAPAVDVNDRTPRYFGLQRENIEGIFFCFLVVDFFIALNRRNELF